MRTHLLGHEAKEDVLQLDEEVVGVDGPVLPCSETQHHLLLKKAMYIKFNFILPNVNTY